MDERGHYSDGKIPFLVDGKRIFRCPLTVITELSWEYIKEYARYERGILPNGPGSNVESKKYLDAMAVLENEYTKWQSRQVSKPKKA